MALYKGQVRKSESKVRLKTGSFFFSPSREQTAVTSSLLLGFWCSLVLKDIFRARWIDCAQKEIHKATETDYMCQKSFFNEILVRELVFARLVHIYKNHSYMQILATQAAPPRSKTSCSSAGSGCISLRGRAMQGVLLSLL